jgi:type VI secretion system Hcp family effector
MQNMRTRLRATLAAAFSIAVALVMPTAAMADLIALQLSGIQGDLTVAGFESFIEVLSLSGNVQTTTKGGTPIFNDLVIHKRFDSSSPRLFGSMVTGTQHDAVIDFARQIRGVAYTTYLTIKLSNVVLTKFETDGSETGGDQEQINLNYSRIQLTALNRNGVPVTVCYDVRANKAC